MPTSGSSSSCASYQRTFDFLLLTAACLLLLASLPAASGQQVKCVRKINSCQCQTESGKYIDLMPLASRDDYRFKRVERLAGFWVYSFNPCFGFKCKGADDVAVCQNEKNGQQEFALGTQNSAEFDYTQEKGLFLKYTSRDAESNLDRVSTVSLECDASAVDTFQPLDDGIPDGSSSVTYSSKVTSKHACEVDNLPAGGGGGGMSPGDILLIILFVGAFVYLAGGFAVNAFAMKKGISASSVPNATFWLALPGFVLDGATFCWGQVRRLFTMRRGGYEST